MVAALLLTGCGIPSDPDGTLEQVSGDVLTVGATESRERVTSIEGDEATGPEPDLVRAFAATVDADVVFVEGNEAELIDLLERGAIDVAVGGFLDDTPWADRAATTLPYDETVDATGTTRRHVLLAPLGENAFLLALDRFLTEQGAP
ncbi:ABC transporter substrate-binding protein [Microbacteriaceae bacterium VKM Ac-2855]|nr:ABC transporter substrate-binding protein [Microbacteriaceae bacterium VKM Ac-2855]